MPSGWTELALHCGGMCSMSDTMENLKIAGSSPLPSRSRIKYLKRNTDGVSRFPKLDQCAHFHYENVEIGEITAKLCDKRPDNNKMAPPSTDSPDKENEVTQLWFYVEVTSNDRMWTIRRNYENFRMLDKQLHRCVYDRKFSVLQELPAVENVIEDEVAKQDRLQDMLNNYLNRFSNLPGELISCGPVLNWFELDNRGNRLIVTDEAAINTPAVAAAYVIKRYTAEATDEISFEVGDMISVIDMPPPEESTWWKGKRGFEVGLFPSECVEVIGEKVPRSLTLPSCPTKPVFRKQGKLIAFFRQFLLSRPSRGKLKQSGILKERVFGCDLGEHLLNTSRQIPLVLKCCAEFIEEHGIVNGIYRLSGINSNIQKLRLAFDEDRAANLNDEAILHDIHCVASLLKMYFRELPNPLLTYQLYEQFVNAVQVEDEAKLIQIRDVVQQLPPPHYRTLEYLMRHLAKIASWGSQTGMTPKNVAIVWAPNLLRSKEMEGGGGACALHVVGVQAVLTEYLIRYVEIIFSGKRPSFQEQPEEAPRRPRRPKSLAISSPTKLLSLEEARTRVLAANILGTEQKYIDVGGGPEKLPVKYHTVIELPSSKRSGTKLKKSPSGWKSFFSRGWQSGSTREKDCGRRGSLKLRKGSTGSLQHAQFPLQEKVITEADLIHTRRIKLRTVKSAESLVSCDTSCRSSSAFESTGPTEGSQNNEAGQSSLLEEDFSSNSQSLNNHVRSSSHESYFDLSSKEESPPGDTAMDDKSSVQASLQTVKKSPESDDSFASFEHIFESFMDSDTIASFDGSWTNFSQDDTKHLSSDSNKMTRKQKLRSSDSDVSSPKVQKLSLRHFRQAFSSPSFSSPNETHKRSEWTLFVKEKDRDALRGSFHRTREKIVHVLTPDSVQKKLFSLLEDKQASLKNDKSRSDIMLYPFPPVHLESDTENLPSRKVKSSSDLQISALACCSDTLSTHYCGDILPQELITAEKSDMHIFDLCFHDNDSETEDDCVKVVDEMLQAVAKKIEEETCGAKLIIEDGVPEENCGAELIIEDGVPEENCGAKLIIEDGVPEENCGAKLIIEDGVPEENCGAELIIEDGVPEENCGAKLIIEDGVPEENCGAELIIEDGVPEENCGAELIIEDGVPEENCGAKLIIEDGVPVEEQLNCVPSSAGQSGKILWTEDENQKSTNSLTTTRDESYNCSGMQIYSINEVCSFDSEIEELNSSISHCDEDSKALVEETTNTQKSFNQSDVMTSAKDDVFCAIKQELNILPQHIPFSKQQDTSREFPESRLPEQRTSLSRITESFLIPQLADMESETLDEEGGNELNDLSKKYKGFRIEDDFSQGSPDVFVDVICDPVPSEQKRSNEKLRKSLIIQNGRLYRTIEKDGDSDKSLKVHSLPDSQNGKDAASVAPLNYPKFQRVCDALNRKSFLDITEQNSKKDVPLDYNRSSPTCKSSQPSLFTQLKVLKLQAFQSPEMSKESIPYDPWSDPILDSVVDPQDIWEKQIFSSSSTPSPSQDDIGEQPLDISKVNINTTRDHRDQELSLQLRMDASTSKEEEETLERFPKTSTPMLVPAEYLLSSPIQSVKSPNMTSVKSLISFDENDRRERIDRYKEERRAQLRERWKSESFKKETPDKKHVGTRWRSSVPLSRTVASLKDQESFKDKKEQSHSSGNLSDPSLGQDMKEGSDDGRKHSHMERLACRSKGRTGREEQNTSSWLTQLPDEEKSNHGSDIIVPKLSSKVKSDCGLDISTEENTLYQSYVPNQTLVHKHKDYCSLRPETSV